MNRFYLSLSSLVLATSAFAKDPPAIPDFTRGAQLERNAPHDWNLGATGARGWVYAHRGESTAVSLEISYEPSGIS